MSSAETATRFVTVDQAHAFVNAVLGSPPLLIHLHAAIGFQTTLNQQDLAAMIGMVSPTTAEEARAKTQAFSAYMRAVCDRLDGISTARPPIQSLDETARAFLTQLGDFPPGNPRLDNLREALRAFVNRS